MNKKSYQEEINYFYESIKNNSGPIVAKIASDVRLEDSKTLNQIAEEAPNEYDLQKIKEIRDYLINKDYISLVDYSTRYMLSGITPDGIKRDLERNFFISNWILHLIHTNFAVLFTNTCEQVYHTLHRILPIIINLLNLIHIPRDEYAEEMCTGFF